jgi:FMN-dependent NADH-azoreductase
MAHCALYDCVWSNLAEAGTAGGATIVIGAPMYNFLIPSSLKAWIDQIVRIEKT